jgi:DNA modification methylase
VPKSSSRASAHTPTARSAEHIDHPTVSAVHEVTLTMLRPWPENPRTISDHRLTDLKRALAADPEMLQARPLLALPDGTVVCGNQRLLAAVELGWQSIPVITIDLDPQRARLWALRDNNSYGSWDEPALAELLAELRADGVELALTGFADRDLDRILAGITSPIDPDEAPPLPVESTSVPGEIYELDGHRLACGDARDPALLDRLFAAETASVVWTDPPYGVDYTGKTSRALTISNDGEDEFAPLLEAAFAVATERLASSAPFYVCCPAGPQGTTFRTTLAGVGWRHRQTLVWVKNSPVLGHSDYHYAHEEILYGHLPGSGRPGRGRHRGSRWYGGNDQTTVFAIDRPSRSVEHPTMKPVALVEAMLANSSRRGEIVFDPFAGSGSTLVACERLGRRCFAVELDAGYCDVIRQRYKEVQGG